MTDMTDMADMADMTDMTDEALVDRVRELELARRAIDAELAALVGEGERRGVHTVDGHRTIRHWLRAHTNCPASEATRLRRLADASDRSPDIGRVLAAGHIGVAQASELARLATHPRVGEQFPAAAPLLLRHAEHLSYEEFRVAARRWEVLADLDGAERSDEVSVERRAATVVPTVDGVDVRAMGGSGMVAAELVGVFERFVEAEFDADVAARTEQYGPDAPASLLPRTDRQRRFDALVEIFRTAVTAPADGLRPQPVVNLLVGEQTYERLVTREATGTDPGGVPHVDLDVERLESTSGVAVSPSDVLAASIVGHVRRVVVDGAGVVVDAGRKRRLFTGVAREMALLLRHTCDHRGCTVPASHCDVDHVEEWDRDDGWTDQRNGRPRCGVHNAWKSAHGLRTIRARDGTSVDVRPDGTPMAPVGRRC